MEVVGVSTVEAPGLRVPSPLMELHDDRLSAAGVRVLLKRDDLIHPELPGNKWRKLKYNLAAARDASASRLLTFGGAYSNHIRAVAAAGQIFGFDTIGVIRGEEHLPLNPSLRFAVERGMRLTYLDRTTCRDKTSATVIDQLHTQFGGFYLIPEGGSNTLALRGCAELIEEIDQDFDVICCASGTGGTLAGIAAALPPSRTAVGFPVLKGGGFLRDDVASLQHDTYGRVTDNWSIETDYHFGGFAKTNDTLREFIDDFENRHGLRLERVYVAKMMFGLFDQIQQRRFPPGTTVVAVITGPEFTTDD